MKEIKIGPYSVGEGHPPFIVAELSGNHNWSLERALQLVEEAKKAGAQAVKLQSYTPDSITMDVASEEFRIRDEESVWHGRTLYDLYSEAHLSEEWHAPLFSRCRELGLVAFSTPFAEETVDFLETFDPPAYKIASPEIVHLPLIRRAAATKKPLILSTGAATLEEIEAAVAAARGAGCRELLLLRCCAAYPAPPEEMRLKALEDMRRRFDCPVGLSDHTLGIGVALAAVTLGASLIEKHFTHSRGEGGIDSHFSLEPQELEELVREAKRGWLALGEPKYGAAASEKQAHANRPSLYFDRPLKAGERIKEGDFRIVRPGYGLPPAKREEVIGKTLLKDVQRGDKVSEELLG